MDELEAKRQEKIRDGYLQGNEAADIVQRQEKLVGVKDPLIITDDVQADMGTANGELASVPQGAPEDVVDTLQQMSRIPAAPEALPIPWWVQHVLWPIVKGWRRFRGLCQQGDNTFKIAVMQWFGVVDALSTEQQVHKGIRRDLDRVAEQTATLIKEHNKAADILKDLRVLNHRGLLALQKARGNKEKES